MAPAAKVWQWLWWLVFGLSFLPGVMCADVTVAPLVAAAAVAFFMLVVVIAMLVIGLTWKNWYPSLQEGKGKVKMPREYWKKKEEARLRLLSGSRSLPASESGLPNGAMISKVHDTASWVQGWNNAQPSPRVVYEDKDLTMELGEEEADEEFRIETTLVDNEALDLGPFHDDDNPPRQQVPQDTVVASMQLEDEEPEDSALYSVVDKSRKTSTRNHDVDPLATSEAVTSFSKNDPTLVAL